MNLTTSLRHIKPSQLWKRAASLRRVLFNRPHSERWEFGREQPSAFYDERFAQKAVQDEHYSQSHYYPLWTVVADRLKRAGVRKVIDVGCGQGQFACLLRDQEILNYLGVDFSALRLEHARRICPEFRFETTNIFESNVLQTGDYDAVVLLEFLEHVERDLDVLEMIRPGTLVMGTVPNFPDVGHVRYFHSAAQVRSRYEGVFSGLRVDSVRGTRGQQTFFVIEGSKC
jgi:2-polyprenyl-3-methyl-5-hydroxy-6-metoxy-1,4-benzoquinol methylase